MIIVSALILCSLGLLAFHWGGALEIERTHRGAAPWRLAADPVGGVLFSANWADHSVYAIDPDTGRLLQRMPLPGHGYDIAYDPGSELLYAVTYRRRLVLVFDRGRPGPEPVKLFRDPERCTYPVGLLALDSGESLVAAVACHPIQRVETLLPKNDDFHWWIYRIQPETAAFADKLELRVFEPIHDSELMPEESLSAWRLEVDPQGRFLWALSSTANNLYRIPLHDPGPIERTTIQDPAGRPLKPSDMALHPDGGLVLISHFFADYISVVGADDLEPKAPWPADPGLSDLVVIDSGTMAALNRALGTITVYCLETGARGREINACLAPMHGLVHRGELFIACAGDGVIQVRDPADWSLTRTLGPWDPESETEANGK